MLSLAAAVHRWLVAIAGELTADESFSWRLAGLSFRELVARTCNDAHPPGHYFALQAGISLAGDSLPALRGFSILMGTACVPLAYLILLRELRDQMDCRGHPGMRAQSSLDRTSIRTWWVPCVPALLIAFSPLQVEAASTIRMYSQGALLLLVALWYFSLPPSGSPFRDRLTWCGYAVSMAALAYTHNFGLLCMMAVSMVAVMEMEKAAVARLDAKRPMAGRRQSEEAAGAPMTRVMWIVGIPTVLYFPWLPTALAQSKWISEGFWLQQQGMGDWSQAFCYWAVGLPIRDTDLALLILVLVLTVGVDAAWQGGRLRSALLAVAALPWIACWASDYFLDRPLLQERYLTFCQLGLLLLQGMAFLSNSPIRVAARFAAGLLLVTHVSAGLLERPNIRHEPVGLKEAVAHVSRQLRDHDLVIHDFTETYNAVRYYLQRDGFQAERVRFPGFQPLGERILGQRSSFSAEDYLDLTRLPEGTRRIWVISRRPPGTVPGWRSIPSALRSVPSIDDRMIEISLWVPKSPSP